MLKEVKIEVTNRCPRNCKHCSANATCTKKNNISLEYEKVIQLIKEAKDMGAITITFTGGEATLWPYLNESIKYASSLDLETKLYTMCYRTEENYMLLSKLINNGLKEIIYSTSFDLIGNEDKSTYSFADFINKITSNLNVKMGFHHVVTKEPLDQISKICATIFSSIKDKNKLSKILLLRYFSHGRGTSDLALNKEELDNISNEIIKLREKYGCYIDIGSPFNILGIEHKKCSSADEIMIVSFNGNVYPCDAIRYFYYLENNCNIYTKSLREIYDSEYFQNIRTAKDYINNGCTKCNRFKICKSGCLAQKLIYYSNAIACDKEEKKNSENGYKIIDKSILNYCAMQKDPVCDIKDKSNIAGHSMKEKIPKTQI
jgi:radical SAM protein with 4Fe4S-binding SPASM domain